MPRWLKFAIGLTAALLTGWISHGPLGQGEAFVGIMEAQAKAVVREAAVPGVEVRFMGGSQGGNRARVTFRASFRGFGKSPERT